MFCTVILIEQLLPAVGNIIKRVSTPCRWAVGVLIFELVTGRPPFYDDDRVKMFKKICEVRYQCPTTLSPVGGDIR